MSDTMRAFVIKEVGRTEVMEKPIPTPGPEEAIVKTTAALICTSDVHTVKGALPVPNDRTLGHESVGVIHSLGSAVTAKFRFRLYSARPISVQTSTKVMKTPSWSSGSR